MTVTQELDTSEAHQEFSTTESFPNEAQAKFLAHYEVVLTRYRALAAAFEKDSDSVEARENLSLFADEVAGLHAEANTLNIPQSILFLMELPHLPEEEQQRYIATETNIDVELSDEIAFQEKLDALKQPRQVA